MEQTNNNSTSLNRKKSIWGGIFIALIAAIALDITAVTIGSEQDVRKQVFNPNAYGQSQFPRICNILNERAVDAQQLAAELAANKKLTMKTYGTPGSVGAFMPVSLTGVVGDLIWSR